MTLPTVQLNETRIQVVRNIEGCIVVTLEWCPGELVERVVGTLGEPELSVLSRALTRLRERIEPAPDRVRTEEVVRSHVAPGRGADGWRTIPTGIQRRGEAMTRPISPTTLAELDALDAAASPGPWLNGPRIMPDDGCVALQAEEHADIYRESPDGPCNIACATFAPEDAGLVVALRNESASLRASARLLHRLLEALPRCHGARWPATSCNRVATREDSNCEPVCDNDEHGAFVEGDGHNYDLPWAPIVREVEGG